MFKDKKNIIILLLVIIILMLIATIIIAITFNRYNKKAVDASTFSSSELLEMFKKEGYEIKITNISGTIYINLDNKTEGITIQRIYDTILGNLMTFDDDSINEEMADILYPSKNDTKEKERQYKAYQSWIEKYNISKTQLSSMLDKYYSENKDKTEVININDLLTTY